MPPRFSLSNLSIKHRLPLLIGALLVGVIVASTWAAYGGVKESALEVGRERLQNLTQQLANVSQQSTTLLVTKTLTAANEPAIRAFIQSPSPATRIGASAILQQFTEPQDSNSLQVEIRDTNNSLVLVGPDGSAPIQVDLEKEFKQATHNPFKTVGALRVVKDTIGFPAVAAVKDDEGKPIGYLVRWRRLSASPDPGRLRDLLGSGATLYFGNTEGDVWTDLVKVVPKPPADLGSILKGTRYARDGDSVMVLGRPISGTPFFLIVEFPERLFVGQSQRFLRRIALVDLVLLAVGVIAAFALSRNITRPLNLLTVSASRISNGDYSGIVEIRQNDELGALGNAFNSMVVRLRNSQGDLEQKIQELKLVQESALELAAIVESSHDGIIGKTSDGTITSWNKGAERIYGYSAEEVVGRSFTILLTPEHPHEIGTILERLKQGESIDHFETEPITKEGKQISVSLTISPIRDETGVVTGASTIARDITASTHAKEALKTSEIRYRRLFESAKDGILILDAEGGQILDVNPYLSEMLGFSKEELVGKELWELGPFSDIVSSKLAFAQLRERGYIRYEDLPLKTREGIVRQVEFVSNVYVAGERHVIQCNIRDITERKLAEEGAFAELQAKTRELASMTQQLWQASKLATMGQLAASVAHELNNPLTTISLQAEVLVGQLATDDPRRGSLLVIEQEVERMAILVSNLLLFSRRSHRQISTVDIREDLTSLLDFIQYHFRSHKIDIVQDLATVLPTVQADRQQLRQVFLNLITNASDAMPEGGTLTVRSRAGAMAGAQTAVIVEFSDTGIGVKTGDLPRLWEPFFTTKPEGKGTGLGLAICRRTVEEHRGTIEIETGPGKGATVRITLPATEEGIKVAA